VQMNGDGELVVVLGFVESLRHRRRLRARHCVRDLMWLGDTLASSLISATDALRFWLSYLNVDRLTPEAKPRAREIWAMGRERRPWIRSASAVPASIPEAGS
jgi:hypothetical protein